MPVLPMGVASKLSRKLEEQELGLRAASNNLRQALHVARRTLHPNPQIASRSLSLSGEQLVICPEGRLWVDVETFEDAAASARRFRDPATYPMRSWRG